MFLTGTLQVTGIAPPLKRQRIQGAAAARTLVEFFKDRFLAAALVLVDRRKLDLDAPVAGAPYTLRHLLQHTSGLPDYGPNPDYHRAVAAGESPWTIGELLRRANASTLLFAPGTRFSYSNIGYLFVRQIIERAAHADLNDALRVLVFDPLGIEGVFVASAVEEFDAIVWGNPQRYHPGWVYHGCVVGSLSWAACRLHRLMHGDLLAPATKNAMLLPRRYDADADAPEDFGYGLGLMIEPARPGERLVTPAQARGSTHHGVFSTRWAGARCGGRGH